MSAYMCLVFVNMLKDEIIFPRIPLLILSVNFYDNVYVVSWIIAKIVSNSMPQQASL